MLLENGAMIKQDVINSFEKAVVAEENVAKGVSTTDFWNFVESDMYMDLSAFYADTYIQECFEKLADEFELDQAAMRLEVLKTDFLGMEA